ncbi:MAG: dephospho-CoA kinase [Thiobacillus sp.]|nr:dephospho-CoA kinase [Thiobacillus sp.]
MFVIGLTGGIGSGKSTVADLFAALGVPVIDTDLIARQLTAADGEALQEIRDTFPDTVTHADGTLDRAVLRRIVFSDAAARKRLEAILHPRIRREVEHRLNQLHAPYAMIVIPLLVETHGYRDLLNRVLVVDCTEAQQLERTMARSKLSREEVVAILDAQVSREQRLAVADDVLTNMATPETLRTDVSMLHQRYLNSAVAHLP